MRKLLKYDLLKQVFLYYKILRKEKSMWGVCVTYTIFAGEAVGEAKKGSGKEKAGEHAGF